MHYRTTKLALSFLALLSAPLAFASGAHAENTPSKLTVKPGSTIVLKSAGCIEPVSPPAGGAVEVAETSAAQTYAIYKAPSSQHSDVDVTIKVGTKEKADKSGCEDGSQETLTVGIDSTPQTSPEALSKAFNILVTAFVLAVLLESAFAIIFNWRAFQAFAVGKAWRTPIMFLAALATVRLFNFDLMAALFDAYGPGTSNVSAGGWFTSVLTAMILSGGSVGVNNILVSLGFRSMTRPDAPDAQANKLEPTQAWVAVKVNGSTPNDAKFQVNVDPLSLDDESKKKIPVVVGLVGKRKVEDRLRDIFFPSSLRVPRAGGYTVSTDQCYRITVREAKAAGRTFDAYGTQIDKLEEAAIFRFGSRAVIDFDIVLPS